VLFLPLVALPLMASAAEDSLPAAIFDGEWRVEREPGSFATPMGSFRVDELSATRFAENRASRRYDLRFTDGVAARRDDVQTRVVRRVVVPVAPRVVDETEYAFLSFDERGERVVLARKTATRWRWDDDERPAALDGDELVHYYQRAPFDDAMFCPLPNNPLPVLALRAHLRLLRR